MINERTETNTLYHGSYSLGIIVYPKINTIKVQTILNDGL